MRILIVEDHADLAMNIGDFLSAQGHRVDFAEDGAVALHVLSQARFDAVVLDLNLPRIDGLVVCQRLRNRLGLDVPVLMLTARDSLADKIKGYQAGAWDYLVKPFALQELQLRLEALRLRTHGTQRCLELGPLRLDVAAQQASRDGREVPLHRACVQILELLMRAAPQVVSRADIEYLLWGDDPPPSNPLRSHMHALRRALDKPFDRALLHTVRGSGYCLRVEVDDASG